MMYVSTATWIMVLAPIAIFQALGILAAVLVGRTGSPAVSFASRKPAGEQRLLDRAA